MKFINGADLLEAVESLSGFFQKFNKGRLSLLFLGLLSAIPFVSEILLSRKCVFSLSISDNYAWVRSFAWSNNGYIALQFLYQRCISVLNIFSNDFNLLDRPFCVDWRMGKCFPLSVRIFPLCGNVLHYLIKSNRSTFTTPLSKSQSEESTEEQSIEIPRLTCRSCFFHIQKVKSSTLCFPSSVKQEVCVLWESVANGRDSDNSWMSFLAVKGEI